MRISCHLLPVFISTVLACAGAQAAEEPDSGRTIGYYRFPAIHQDVIVFTAEGDLWRVGFRGGAAQRLTSHLGTESHAAISADGRTLAFSAEYEGPTEVYTMPLEGGPPTRRTYEGQNASVAGWTPEGKVLYSTSHFSTLPDQKLAVVDLKVGVSTVLPLSQASDGTFDPAGKVLYFTRQPFQGSSTKRYQGGTAQGLWKFELGSAEAVPLTADFPGTSKNPMFWQNQIYFITDRDGTMNLWSMDLKGGDLRQHTFHKGWDVKAASLWAGLIAYQLGADLWLLDLAKKTDAIIPITLTSDFDQDREKWVKKPADFLTSGHLSPDGDRLALTARGQVFVAPVEQGRFVEVTRQDRVRYRDARFMPDGKSLLVLSDQTGELEFEKLPANGVGQPEPLTHDGKIFRFDGISSPDGKFVAYQDKNQQLWLLDVEQKRNLPIATNNVESFLDLRWSPDSQWLAYVSAADNDYLRISLYHLKDGATTILTSDRVNSFSPAWSADGKWIYFLSERRLESVVPSPWGPREPEPFFYEPVKLYLVSLVKDGRSPFEPNDELHPAQKTKPESEKPGAKETSETKAKTAEPAEKSKATEAKSAETNQPPAVAIDLEGLQNRVTAVPVPPGDYTSLAVTAKHLFWISRTIGAAAKTNVMTLEITNNEPKPKVFAEDVRQFELSEDNHKILLSKGDDFFVVDSTKDAPVKLEKSVDLKNWNFSLSPREERRQMFVEAWRLMRDFFYDTNMQGVDWPAMRAKYLPLADRVRDRAELSDLIADMVGELSALHTFVRGGDYREGPDQIQPASLGAALTRDEALGGYRIEHIYRSDPNFPERLSPLAKPGLNLSEGDIIQAINGVPVLSVPHPAALLRNQEGRQTLLSVKLAAEPKPRDVIVTPISLARDADLRYGDWEYSRRLLVEELGKGDIGYVHLRAMGARDIATWASDFYPVFNRKGLIIDVRHNGGGSIDSWILEKLMRKAWFYWQPRVGNPTWNMQYSFRGHAVVLCDERTGSDGEAFTEGFRRLGLGKIIGTRTWGGEIWLSMDNWLVDHGIASAAEFGVYGPEGKWLIEGHGVDPDLVVDNLPHSTFEGEDAQLKAAIGELQEQIRLNPVTVPPRPPYPNKAFK
jgi:tricorn protease